MDKIISSEKLRENGRKLLERLPVASNCECSVRWTAEMQLLHAMVALVRKRSVKIVCLDRARGFDADPLVWPTLVSKQVVMVSLQLVRTLPDSHLPIS